MANPAQFARNILKRAKNVERETIKVTRIGASAALRTAVLATPVDTGRARGSWDVNVGGPGSSGNALDPTGGSAISKGISRIATVKTDTSIYISSDLEYIGKLENGSSAQAPSGMTARAVTAAQAAVRSAKIKI